MVKRDNLHVFSDTIFKNVMRTLNVGTLARVTKLDSDNWVADLQPMPLTESEMQRAPLMNVHISKTVRDILKVGDVAIVLFLDRNINNFDGTNKNFIIANNRTHSVNDAVIVGVL